MENLIIIAVLVLIVGASVTYIIKAKKKGVKCIGCPAGATCSGKCSGTSGCGGCHGDSEEHNNPK